MLLYSALSPSFYLVFPHLLCLVPSVHLAPHPKPNCSQHTNRRTYNKYKHHYVLIMCGKRISKISMNMQTTQLDI